MSSTDQVAHEHQVYDENPPTVDASDLFKLLQECFEGPLSDAEENDEGGEDNDDVQPGPIRTAAQDRSRHSPLAQVARDGTSIPGQKKSRKPRRRGEDNEDPRRIADVRRDMRRMTNLALEAKNTITYQTYSLKDDITNRGTGQRTTPASENTAQWDGNNATRYDGSTPRCGRDKDGKLLWIMLPNAIKNKGSVRVSLQSLGHEHAEKDLTQDYLTKQLIKFGELVQLTRGTGADKGGRDKASAYTMLKGSLTGVFNYVIAWTGIGHDNEEAAISAASIKTAKTFRNAQKLVADLGLLSHRINEVLKTADPAAFEASTKLRECIIQDEPYAQVLCSIDPLLWVGRSIIFNRTTPPHKDRRDELTAWTPLVTLGDSKGGDLFLPGLRTRLFYEPGTIIFVRGGSIKHGVMEWTGKQRICLASFTHKYIWAKYGLSHPL